jgi:recombinational DNA repair protein (RecF pathway)
MNKKLRQSLTVFMAMLVLLSSTGFGFIEHECMMRGKSLQLLSQKKAVNSAEKVSSCCAKSKVQKESKGTFFKKTDCCKESQKFEKLDVPSQSSQIQAKFIKNLLAGITWSATSFTFQQAEWILPTYRYSTDILSFSSRLHGRGMRSFIQSFLI